MGSAIGKSLQKAGFKVVVSAPDQKIHDNKKIPGLADVIILAVRPPVVAQVAEEIAPLINKKHIVISIATGVPLNFFEKKFPRGTKLARVMPNLPAQVGCGVSGWISKNLLATEKKTVRKILESFGEAVEMKKEDNMNAVTAVSGSGPAYVFAILESLEKQAVKMGIRRADAKLLALMTLAGSVAYAADAVKQNTDFKTLKNMVKTKGGTTEAAFKVLDKAGWQSTFEKAIVAAYARAREIEKQSS